MTMARLSGTILTDDDLFRALRVQFTDAQIVELGMMIGQYIGFGRLVSVLDLERPECTL